ncbi:hypothetical protein ACIBCA_18075 [Kitasatospora sp. NPDC051170]|uniref:hypothetical protein n=1 Tax=Kitasatospora sp. NPDC051170 TaxID=3364056 RepID=UPI00378ACAAC
MTSVANGTGVARRTVLWAGLLVTGCAGAGGGRPGPSGTPTGTREAVQAPAQVPLPGPALWQPGPDELQPDVKRRAVEVVAAVAAWPVGGQGVEAARRRVVVLGLPGGLVEQAQGLITGEPEATVEVVDAQYGGLLDDSASVLVVCRRWTRGPDGSVVEGGTTVDVRLSRAEPRWTVTELHPGAPGAAAATPAPAVARVLAEPRIELPPEAVADLRSGAVHDSVLEAMLRLAGPYAFSVSVVRSGHPLDVFGTTRPSDHPLGRAFDVWRIDGHPVVDRATSRGLIEQFMRDAAAAGSYNVGGPLAVQGGVGNQFFTDDTHHDHVHVGFKS